LPWVDRPELAYYCGLSKIVAVGTNHLVVCA
jgi:hypothetical protein